MIQETRGKWVYAVLLEVRPHYCIIARGTSNPAHDEKQLVSTSIKPGSKAARRWRNPPITTETYFYSFDIRPVAPAIIRPENVQGFCEQNLFEALKNAMYQEIERVLAGATNRRWSWLDTQELKTGDKKPQSENSGSP